MKREAYRHPKMFDFASRLGVPRSHAVGLIQLLLDFTADNAPQGNIGKWPDGAIARGCEWDGDASFFVQCLVDAGWVDRCHTHRLVIHDLAEHAEQWWKLKVAKLNKRFLVAVAEPSAEPSAVPSAEATAERSILLSPSLLSPPTHTHKIPPMFDSLDVRNALNRWAEFYTSREGRCLTEIELNARLLEAARKGWDSGKLIRSLDFSILKGAKSWLDPDDSFDDRPRRGRPAKDRSIPQLVITDGSDKR